ncbi:NAD-dependent epimerase/dehydratase family protein [Acinetobacter guillouiae]|uniref:NAD-dependent epimerase/dehydratase family protein n=1 Tax=Acinetobacter guillouiae TaxID=106649 RepID=UPI00300B5ED2
MTNLEEIVRKIMQRIFITGANGYLGRNLAKYLADKGYFITALTRTTKIHSQLKHTNIQYAVGDLFSVNLKDLMKTSNILIHAAGDTDHTNKSKTQLKTNVDGTERVLSIAKNLGFTKFIHISTESVLSTGKELINVNENHPIPSQHVGNYSFSKALAEQIALSYATDAFRGIVIRPRMIWGRDDTTALSQLVQAAKNNQLAWIDGGNYLTSTTHIINLCHGIELALNSEKIKEIYAITDGEPILFKEFVSLLLKTQNIPITTKEVSRKLLKNLAKTCDLLHKLSLGYLNGPITFQQYSASAVEITLDIGKAQKELNYFPIVTREQGLLEIQKSLNA